MRLDERIELDDDCERFDNPLNKTKMCYARFDNRQESRLSAIINICSTLFICIVLIGGSICFNRDIKNRVLKPFEKIIDKIRKVTVNPCKALQDHEFEEYISLLNKLKNKDRSKCCNTNLTQRYQKLETNILDKTIVKIGSILSMGIGEAGCNLIEQNILESENFSVDPTLPGTRLSGLCAVISIQDYPLLIRQLGNKTIIFLAKVLETVNEILTQHNVYAIRNTGKGFLLIWNFNEKMEKDYSLFVENAVSSVLRIIMKIYSSRDLEKVNIFLNSAFHPLLLTTI